MGYLDGTTPVIVDGSAAGNGPITADSSQNVNVVDVERREGSLRATWTRPLVSPDASDIDITTGSLSAAWAYNSDTTPSGSSYALHTDRNPFSVDLTQTASCGPAAPPPPASGTSTIDLQNAFSFSDGPFSLRFKVDQANSRISFSMSTTGSSGYVSIGLASSPGLMSPADVYAGFPSSASSSGFVVSDRSNAGRSSPADATQNVLGVTGEMVNGRMTVSFSRDLNTGDPGDTVISNAEYNLIWAVSPTTPGGGAGSATSGIGQHTTRSSDAIKINFFTGEVSKDDLITKLKKAHGVLAILAWIFFVPTAIIIARFAKDALGVWWYRIHLGMQILACLMTFALFGLAIHFTVDDFKGENKTHKAMGLVITILALIQPILGEVANLLWSPERTGTPFFPDKVHWLLGYALFIIGVVNCFLGIKAFEDWDTAANAIAGTLVALFVVAFIALQFTIGSVHHNADDDAPKANDNVSIIGDDDL